VSLPNQHSQCLCSSRSEVQNVEDSYLNLNRGGHTINITHFHDLLLEDGEFISLKMMVTVWFWVWKRPNHCLRVLVGFHTIVEVDSDFKLILTWPSSHRVSITKKLARHSAGHRADTYRHQQFPSSSQRSDKKSLLTYTVIYLNGRAKRVTCHPRKSHSYSRIPSIVCRNNKSLLGSEGFKCCKVKRAQT
jgi:hypothetical protein